MKPKGERRQIVSYTSIDVSQVFGPRSGSKVWVNLRRAYHAKARWCDVTVHYNLLTKNLNLPKGRACKLCPKFIGPFKITQTQPETSNYTLELPVVLQM